jgi:hypothetical protein
MNLFVTKFGKSFFTNFSNDTFHEICLKHSKNGIEKIMNYLNFIAEQNDLETLGKNITGKNSKNQTILFYFHQNTSSDLIKMLGWLETTFKNVGNFVENFLLEVDENLDSFLNFVLKRCDSRKIDNFYTETYFFLITKHDKSLVKKILLRENKENENFMNIIYERDNRIVTYILDTLFRNFRNDLDFFAKLINEKLKKNWNVRNWMRRNKYCTLN